MDDRRKPNPYDPTVSESESNEQSAHDALVFGTFGLEGVGLLPGSGYRTASRAASAASRKNAAMAAQFRKDMDNLLKMRLAATERAGGRIDQLVQNEWGVPKKDW